MAIPDENILPKCLGTYSAQICAFRATSAMQRVERLFRIISILKQSSWENWYYGFVLKQPVWAHYRTVTPTWKDLQTETKNIRKFF